ncbi:hypothetical protein DB30_07557 [Enhygromyxa salina]|uniref:Uncharacterized protein n=1 Tax=Enhygromyxa salina TaxID=215803 RepID=A0A0C2CRC8_9BACT|nr:DUF6159 family protein [Enhygromyxa salina]KIG13711.1 hypothetical protein DB30_07557 [Enhygromyxa salina]
MIDKDKELLLFALIGGVLSIGWILAVVWPYASVAMETGSADVEQMTVVDWIFCFLLYLGLAFIGTFTKVCITYTTKVRFEGGDATFGESIRFAFSRLLQILGWALARATVGMILLALRQIAEKFGAIGKIVIRTLEGVLGGLWEILTAFVVPAMVYEGVGPIDGFKTSAGLFKKTWGESLVKQIGFGWMQSLSIFGVTVFTAGLFTVFSTGNLLWIPFGFAVFGYVSVALLFSVASSVYDTALYVYATSERVVGYDQELMEGAFGTKQ